MKNKFQKKAIMKEACKPKDGKGGPGDRALMSKIPDRISGEKDSNMWGKSGLRSAFDTMQDPAKFAAPRNDKFAESQQSPASEVEWSPRDAGEKAQRKDKMDKLKKSVDEAKKKSDAAGSKMGILKETVKGAMDTAAKHPVLTALTLGAPLGSGTVVRELKKRFSNK